MGRSRNFRNKLDQGSGGDGLQFPEEIGEFDSFIKFTRLSGDEGKPGKSIKLFIPPSVDESLNVSYNETEVKLQNTVRIAESMASEVQDAFAEGGSNAALQSISDQLGDVFKTVGTAMIPGEALGQLAQIRSRTVKNPALSFLFESVAHREFNFSFMMVPRSQAESNAIRDIIKEFKEIATPGLAGGGKVTRSRQGGGRTGDAFLKYPDNVQVKYKNENFLHKFKPAVIKDVSVKYNPQSGSTWTQFKDTKAPTNVQLDITIQELSIVVNDDVKEGY